MLIILVHNDGTGTDEVGNYTYEVRVNSNMIETGEIKEHLRSESWKALLAKVVLPTSRALDGADWWDCECGVANHPSWQACQFCKYPRRQ